jgi:hypothetical protein
MIESWCLNRILVNASCSARKKKRFQTRSLRMHYLRRIKAGLNKTVIALLTLLLWFLLEIKPEYWVHECEFMKYQSWHNLWFRQLNPISNMHLASQEETMNPGDKELLWTRHSHCHSWEVMRENATKKTQNKNNKKATTRICTFSQSHWTSGKKKLSVLRR